MANNINTNNFLTAFDPSNAGAYAKLQRQQQIIQQLQNSAMENDNNFSSNLAIVPKYGIGLGLEKLAKALLASRAADVVDQNSGALQSASYQNLQNKLDPNQHSPQQQQNISQALQSGAEQGSVGPTENNLQLAQALNSMTDQPRQPTGSSLNPLGMSKDIAAMMLMNNPDKYWEAQAGAYKPTEASLLARAAGVDPTIANQQALQKSNYISPVNARAGSTLLDPLTQKPIFNAPNSEGIQYQFDQNGQPSANMVPGFQQALSAYEAARLQGKNTQTLAPAQYSQTLPNGQIVPSSINQALNQGTVPNQGFPSNQQVPSPTESGTMVAGQNDRLSILQQELASEKDPMNRASLMREISNVSKNPVSQPMPQQEGLGPKYGQEAGAVNAQKELSDKFSTLNQANQNSQGIISNLQNIKQYAQKASLGKFSDKLDYMNSLLAIVNEHANDVTTASNLLNKNINQIVVKTTQGQNNQGLASDAGKIVNAAANPNQQMNLQAINEVTDNLIASQKMTQAKASLLSPIANSRDPSSYANKEVIFDQNADPRIFQYSSMNPQQKSLFRENLLKTGQADDFSRKIKALHSLGVQF